MLVKDFVNLVREQVSEQKTRSKWDRGVIEYAHELLDELLENCPDTEITNRKELNDCLLNGARDWKQYSEGGCSLITDGEVAERLATNSQLKRTDNGRLAPNANDTWLEIQAHALAIAAVIIKGLFK